MKRNTKLYKLFSKLISPISRKHYNARLASTISSSSELICDDDVIDKHWHRYKTDLVRSRFETSRIVLECLGECVWYHDSSGPMLFRYFQGDAQLSLSVKTRKLSNKDEYPDSYFQFGGVIIRDPSSSATGARENYVFNVIGFRGSRLQIENKSTLNGYSQVSATDWEEGDADLCIERRGASVIMKAKPIGSSVWTELYRYSREDLPHVMQLGLIAYAFSDGKGIHDLRVEFSDFVFKSL